MGKVDPLFAELAKIIGSTGKNQPVIPQVPNGITPATPTQPKDMAKYLLDHSVANFQNGNSAPATPAANPITAHKDPGLISRFFDVLSRPLYTTAGAVKGASDSELSGGSVLDQLKAAGSRAVSGFEGKTKDTFSGLIKEDPNAPKWAKNGVSGFATGFVADVLGDPTSALGPAQVKGLYNLGKGGLGKALGVAKDTVTEAAPTMEAQANLAHRAVETAVDKAAQANAAASPAGAKQMMSDFLKFDSNNALKAAGASQNTVQATNDLVRNILKHSETLPQQAIQKHSGALEAVTAAGSYKVPAVPSRGALQAQMGGKLPDAFRRAVEDTTKGIKETVPTVAEPIRSGKTVSAPKVVDGFMNRMFTLWGNKTLRPFVNDAKDSAMAHAEARAAMLTPAFKGLNEEEREMGMRLAQGKIPRELVDHPGVLRLADTIQNSMESLLSSSGIRDAAAKGNTVALRSGMIMDDLNEMLKFYGGSKMKLTNGVIKTKDGAIKDYSQGADWLKSWEHPDLAGKDVGKQIFIMNQAVEQVTRRYSFLDEVGANFGSDIAKPGWVKASHPRLEGKYFPKEINDELNVALKHFDDMYRPNSKFISNFREVTNIWKTLVTIPNPNHHINNTMGDIFLAWMGGVNNPNVYRKAASVLRHQDKAFHSEAIRAGDFDKMQTLIGQDALKNALASTRGKEVLKTGKGFPMTDEQVYIAAHQNGLLQDMRMYQDIMGDAKYSMKMTQGKMNPLHWGSAVATKESKWTRLAHFIDALQKSKEPTLEKAIKEAAHITRKWHPDGMDMTKAEQKAKLLIPFYSWLRKSTPLIGEGVLLHPNKVSTTNKTFYEMQSARGEDPQINDPFNTAGMWPGFLTSPGTKSGVFAPRNPMNDFMTQVAQGIDNPGTLGSVLTPALKVPYELMTGSHMGGGHIADKGKYLEQQIPITSRMQSMATSSNPNARLNWATGLNKVEPATPYESAKNTSYAQKAARTAMLKPMREWAFSHGLIKDANGKIPKWVESLYMQSQGGKK